MLHELFMDRLKACAKRTRRSDEEDFMVNDFAAGNIDDAYDIGFTDGETQLAQEILTAMNIDWNE